MTTALRALGVLLLALGVLWSLQGLGIVGGSFMSGQRQWLVAGILTAMAGLVLLLWSRLGQS